MQEVPRMSGALADQTVGRWAVALAATAAFMVVGGYLGTVSSAQAGGEPGDNVGPLGRDGQSFTCYAYLFPRDDAPVCIVVGR
jgi:hypothetical protein